MNSSNPLIPFVGEAQQNVAEVDFSVLKQAQVVHSPFARRNCKKLPTLEVNHQLRFERMPFVLATVKGSLFFWGRSIGTSVTSTITASQVTGRLLQLSLAWQPKST